MSFKATLTIEASMMAMINPSMTVSVIMASGGFALRSARRSAAASRASARGWVTVWALDDTPIPYPRRTSADASPCSLPGAQRAPVRSLRAATSALRRSICRCMPTCLARSPRCCARSAAFSA